MLATAISTAGRYSKSNGAVSNARDGNIGAAVIDHKQDLYSFLLYLCPAALNDLDVIRATH